jgi:biopolymer transport protein ExbD
MKKHIVVIGCFLAALAIVGCSRSASTPSPNLTKQQVSISFAADGTLSVAGEQCSPEALAAKLRQLKTTAVILQLNASTPSNQVAAVLSACDAARVKRTTLAYKQ